MKVVIIGAGSHAKVLMDIISLNKDIEIFGFTDVNKELHGEKIGNIKIIGDDSILENLYNQGVKSA